MPPIGETLREARLRRSVEIAEVSAHTKIRAKYLYALESEEFDQLPGPTYVRTFLRTYAEYLGLDPHLLVEEYRQRFPAQAEEDALVPFSPSPAGGRTRQRDSGGSRSLRPGPFPPGGPGTLAAGVVVAIVLIFLLIGVFTEPEVSRPPVTSSRPTSSSPPKTETARSKPTKEKPAKAGRVELKISPDGPTYLCVDDGSGNVVFQETTDKPETFRGKALRINMGRAAGTVEADGKAIKIPEGPDPVGYAFAPGKARPVPDGERPCQ